MWFRDSDGAAKYLDKDGGSLCVGAHGNLTLHAYDGKALWQSHTSDTGDHNRLIITNAGNIELRTATNKIVWMSHTTSVMLVGGQRLASGTRLVNRWDDHPHAPVSYLTMTSSGDLQLAVGTKVYWHSRTHSAGAYAFLRWGGNLAVYSAAGRMLWQSHSGGHRGPIWLRFMCGSMWISSGIDQIYQSSGGDYLC